MSETTVASSMNLTLICTSLATSWSYSVISLSLSPRPTTLKESRTWYEWECNYLLIHLSIPLMVGSLGWAYWSEATTTGSNTSSAMTTSPSQSITMSRRAPHRPAHHAIVSYAPRRQADVQDLGVEPDDVVHEPERITEVPDVPEVLAVTRVPAAAGVSTKAEPMATNQAYPVTPCFSRKNRNVKSRCE